MDARGNKKFQINILKNTKVIKTFRTLDTQAETKRKENS